jgi:hypothetical protein
MRARTVLAVGAGIAVIAIAAGLLVAAISSDGEMAGTTSPLLATAAVVVLLVAWGLVLGWFDVTPARCLPAACSRCRSLIWRVLPSESQR